MVKAILAGLVVCFALVGLVLTALQVPAVYRDAQFLRALRLEAQQRAARQQQLQPPPVVK